MVSSAETLFSIPGPFVLPTAPPPSGMLELLAKDDDLHSDDDPRSKQTSRAVATCRREEKLKLIYKQVQL